VVLPRWPSALKTPKVPRSGSLTESGVLLRLELVLQWHSQLGLGCELE
jgi:hypothetical protein